MPNGDNVLTYLKLRGVPQDGWLQHISFDANNGGIGGCVTSDDLGLKTLPVAQCDDDALSPGNNMVVGKNMTVLVED
jgi:hypothetical protein